MRWLSFYFPYTVTRHIIMPRPIKYISRHSKRGTFTSFTPGIGHTLNFHYLKGNAVHYTASHRVEWSESANCELKLYAFQRAWNFDMLCNHSLSEEGNVRFPHSVVGSENLFNGVSYFSLIHCCLGSYQPLSWRPYVLHGFILAVCLI